MLLALFTLLLAPGSETEVKLELCMVLLLFNFLPDTGETDDDIL
jgi:hypothetical protein